jgi:signal transduction histidine kinase
LKPFSKNSIALLAITAAVAAALLLASFQYSNYTSGEILKIAAEDIRSNTKIQAHDLERIFVNRIDAVTTNTLIIANTPSVHSGSDQARTVFDTAQSSTKEFTDFYMWLDSRGRLQWLSNINQTTYESVRGTDLSYRSYFTETRDRMESYYSSVIDSNDNIPRLYIADPIINEDGAFEGAVIAAIRIDTLGEVLKSELAPGFESSVGMIDRNGIILYTTNQTFVGKDVFGPEFQAILPEPIEESFNAFLRRSLQGNSGVDDISYAGATATLAYEPIILKGEQFGTLYVTAQHKFAGNVGALVDQQRNFSTIVTIAIAGIAGGIGVLIVVWNRRLEETVAERTSQLKSKTEELKKSYDALASANEQLKVHDKMQKEFINIAAHELRTPTQAILGYAELLQMEPSEGDEMVKAIYRNSVRLQRLTSDILDVTRIESEALKLDKEKFNLSDVISAAIQDSRNQLSNGQIKFVHQPSGVYVEADRTRITQVISNLIDNATKFTKEGTITVSAERKNGNVVVTVTDTGKGIDGEIMPRLFSKFATKSDKGTGLGLFISKSIIEAHDGKIWAGNNSDGKGAMFAFSLPA